MGSEHEGDLGEGHVPHPLADFMQQIGIFLSQQYSNSTVFSVHALARAIHHRQLQVIADPDPIVHQGAAVVLGAGGHGLALL